MCRSDNWGGCRRPRGDLNATRQPRLIPHNHFYCFISLLSAPNGREQKGSYTLFRKFQCQSYLLKNLMKSTHHQSCVLARGETSVTMMCPAKVAGGKGPSAEGHKYQYAEHLFIFACNEPFSLNSQAHRGKIK